MTEANPMPFALKQEGLLPSCLLALISSCCIGFGIYSDKYYICILPLAAVVTWAAFHDYKIVYFLLLFSLPFSVQLSIGTIAIDLPSEPLMIALLIITVILLIKNRDSDLSFLKHPITFLLLAHFLWMILISFFSVNPLHSVKYLLSKTWYMASFYFFTCLLLQKIGDFRRIFWIMFIPFVIVIIYTIIRHQQLGFEFETSNLPMNPFFINHVMYSTTLAVFFPFVIFAFRNKIYNYNIFRNLALGLGIILFLFAIGFSYTRASWLALPIGLLVYFIVKKNLLKISLVLCGITLAASIIYLSWNYRYMAYAPNYLKTIFHKGDIHGHLKATYNMQDASGMERIYRWVAAKRMVEDKPFFGTGPSTFYPEYQSYTLNSFHTYVSNNPEKSSTHNYFLMVLCEQGVIGFLLFSSIAVMLLLIGSRLYNSSHDVQFRNLAMACTIALVILYFHLMLNDLIETDKVGSLFFITMAVLVKLDQWSKQQPEERLIAN
jgi:O-antigen ligase